MSIKSFYIHIPFCQKKCLYCDFVSYAGKEDLRDDYVEALCREINLRLTAYLPDRQVGGLPLTTIYFGGGTPTLLELRHFEKIFSLLRLRLSINKQLEITTEANPATADRYKLKKLKELGVNRLSIGAQTFNDKHLQTLGRIHNSADIYQIYADARKVGFENINLDLIFALPHQTFADWKEDLHKALELNPEHFSTYNLQIEEGTPFYFRQTTNGLRLPDEETELAMYEYAIETLTNTGYKHYEISNFAKPGFECQHNVNYWKNGNYLGIGAGAHSHLNGKRWSNPDSIEEYLDSRYSLFEKKDKTSCVTDRQETIFLGLRMLEGLTKENFAGFEKEATELLKDGLLVQENNHYKLTRRGLYLANLVFEKFV